MSESRRVTAVSAISFGQVFSRLAAGDTLEPGEVRAAFEAILSGMWTSVQVGAFATALRIRGESAETIVAGAQALRGAMTPVDHEIDPVLDTCGTGGDGAQTLNISTAAAIVVAACGVTVAKHGNRSVSSQCGSADVVEALGIPIDVPPNRQGEILREAKIAFLFAPAHHPALKHAAQARRELGIRTIFNALGPLANPAKASHQLLGVYDDTLRAVVARALGTLGVKRAWVVRSEDGLDEVSPSAPTRVSELLEGGEVRERVVTPEAFGLPRLPREAIGGGSSQWNAEAIVQILDGSPHAARDAVILNAAAALAVTDANGSLLDCTARARQAIDSGAARRVLEVWREAARKRRPA
jgi:anthranilate phosphoribosyltransferase